LNGFPYKKKKNSYNQLGLGCVVSRYVKSALNGLVVVVNRVIFSVFIPGSIFYVRPCHSCGVLPAHWACRIFSGPWRIIVVHVNWSGHPTLIKKKNM